jgi:hypothetical protein
VELQALVDGWVRLVRARRPPRAAGLTPRVAELFFFYELPEDAHAPELASSPREPPHEQGQDGHEQERELARWVAFAMCFLAPLGAVPKLSSVIYLLHELLPVRDCTQAADVLFTLLATLPAASYSEDAKLALFFSVPREETTRPAAVPTPPKRNPMALVKLPPQQTSQQSVLPPPPRASRVLLFGSQPFARSSAAPPATVEQVERDLAALESPEQLAQLDPEIFAAYQARLPRIYEGSALTYYAAARHALDSRCGGGGGGGGSASATTRPSADPARLWTPALVEAVLAVAEYRGQRPSLACLQLMSKPAYLSRAAVFEYLLRPGVVLAFERAAPLLRLLHLRFEDPALRQNKDGSLSPRLSKQRGAAMSRRTFAKCLQQAKVGLGIPDSELKNALLALLDKGALLDKIYSVAADQSLDGGLREKQFREALGRIAVALAIEVSIPRAAPSEPNVERALALLLRCLLGLEQRMPEIALCEWF